MADTARSPMREPLEVSFQCVRLYLGDAVVLVSPEEDGIGEQRVVVEAWHEAESGPREHIRVVCRGRREYGALIEALEWAASVAWPQQ